MHPVRRQISPHAARLRRDRTDAERIIWYAVRDRRLGGYKFRRQTTIGPYIVDFLCVERHLIVELDGGQHSEERDAHRTAYLQAQGYRVLRFWNNEAIGNREGVLTTILNALENPYPAFAGEEQIVSNQVHMMHW